MTPPATSEAPVVSDGALYLTQILVGFEKAIGDLQIRDAYDWHQRVWQAFGGRDGQARDFLIRVDRQDDAYRLLILSSFPPTVPAWCPQECFSWKAVPDAFFEHTRYRFRVLANPTKKIRVDTSEGVRKKNGRRVPITSREELVKWIARKALVGGFRISPEDVRTVSHGRTMFQKLGVKGTHTSVDFEGELEVVNPIQFRAAVANGIGSAKAFGFGLLVIAPVD